MAHTYEEISGMTVAQLRELASGIEHEAVQGYTQLHKEQLIPAICTALGIEARVHHEVVGLDKKAVKAQISALKTKRTAALEAKDGKELKRVRRNIRKLKHKMRRAMV
jgi:hypothetical protein